MCTSSLLPRQNHRVFLLGPHVTMCTVKAIKLEFSLLTKKRLPKTCSSGTTWRRKVWELWFGGCSCHNFSRRLISWGLSFSKATLAVYALHFPGKIRGSASSRWGWLQLCWRLSDDKLSARICNQQTKTQHGEEQQAHLLSQSYLLLRKIVCFCWIIFRNLLFNLLIPSAAYLQILKTEKIPFMQLIILTLSPRANLFRKTAVYWVWDNW